jgi:hypothetical protein
MSQVMSIIETNCVNSTVEPEIDQELLEQIMLARGCLESISKQMEEEGSTEELEQEKHKVEEDLHLMYWEFGVVVGLKNLKDLRRYIGLNISVFNQYQEKHYKLQKARYQSCKQAKHFSKEDREYIEIHKQKNDYYMDTREQLYDLRDLVAAIIEAVDPNDFDFGWDEHWETPENFEQMIEQDVC